jgi:hypothetical protein
MDSPLHNTPIQSLGHLRDTPARLSPTSTPGSLRLADREPRLAVSCWGTRGGNSHGATGPIFEA